MWVESEKPQGFLCLHFLVCCWGKESKSSKMRPLSSLGIALSLIFGLLFLAFVFEVYYLLWWKKRITNHDSEEEPTITITASPTSNVLPILCCNHSSSLSAAPLNIAAATNNDCYDMKPSESDTDPMRFYSFTNPMGILFTIKEETKEDLESEEERRSRGRSLSDVVIPIETPYLTPLSSPPFFTPPLTPLNNYGGFNPLFEAVERAEGVWLVASPPPKFKFMRDAEEKLYRRTLMEEAAKVRRSNGFGPGCHQEHLQQHSCSSHQHVAQIDSSRQPAWNIY